MSNLYSQGILAIEGGIDITNPATLEARLWRACRRWCAQWGLSLGVPQMATWGMYSLS